MKKTHWSTEEIDRLKQIMTRYSSDKEGCQIAAQELNRSYSGTLAKWYQIKPNKKVFKTVKEIADILYKNISNNPGNIQDAIRLTAKQTNRSQRYVEYLYYNKKSPYYHKDSDICFTLLSKKSAHINSKNYNDGKTSKDTKSLIKKWVIKVFKIKKEDL